MKQLVLTSLGNEVNLSTGKTVFTACFNGSIRIEISQEAAQLLTEQIYSAPKEPEHSPVGGQIYINPGNGGGGRQSLESEAEEFGGDVNVVTGEAVLQDNPGSVYDEDTGVEQV